MTVCTKVIKETITLAIENMIKDLCAADSHYGYFRDLELSSKKIELLKTLKEKIKEYKPVELDSENLEALKELIRTAYTEIEILHTEKKITNGTTYTKLTTLEITCGKIYTCLEKSFTNPKAPDFFTAQTTELESKKAIKVNLLNLPDDKTPFSQFCFYAISYLATKIYQQSLAQLIDTASRALSPAPPIETQTLKRNALQERLWRCYETIQGLDDKDADHINYQRQITLLAIEALISDNKIICDRPEAKRSFPIPYVSTLSIFGFTTQSLCGLGDLDKYMQLAKKELESPTFSTVLQP